jgi:3-oxoacyl-[acyl-carrier-protein] synthase II
MKHRVVITGMGVCAPNGRDVKTFGESLLAGRSGISRVRLFDTSTLPVRIGGEVKTLAMNDLAARFPGAQGERDRKIWLGLDAASQAVDASGLPAGVFADALVSVGVSLESLMLESLGAFVQGMPTPSRTDIPPQTPLDRLAQVLGEHYGTSVFPLTNCSACAAGAQSIGEAYWRVRDGSARLALAGAADSTLNPLGLGGFSLLQILSTENDRPGEACRPFDLTRQGTVLSEGAAFLVLETARSAEARGAMIYGEIAGFGSSLDAYRVTDPEPRGEGAALSMARAMADAGMRPEDIDSINAHGTGTVKNDRAETLGIKLALGNRALAIPVTANKSMTGHMIASSGAAEAVASVLTLVTGWIPPVLNLKTPDPECNLDCVTGAPRRFEGRTVLSNSFGFGGQNATLIFRKFKP